MLDEKEKTKQVKMYDLKRRQLQNEKTYENIGYKKKQEVKVEKEYVENDLK